MVSYMFHPNSRREKMGGEEGYLGLKATSCIWMKCRERKNCFVKNNIPRNIHTSRSYVKALEAFMEITVPKEGTSF